jgi:hypothetical protein
MKDFAGRIAVITGGGTGMGRELVRQLVAEGCNVAMCDVSAPAMAETRRLCETERLPQGLRITTHVTDVSDEAQVQRFRTEVAERQDTDKIHLLFNNAGIGGGGSMIANGRDEWERTFNICWGGVYLTHVRQTSGILPVSGCFGMENGRKTWSFLAHEVCSAIKYTLWLPSPPRRGTLRICSFAAPTPATARPEKLTSPIAWWRRCA